MICFAISCTKYIQWKIHPENIYKFHNRLCQAQARCCVKITRHETATEVSHSAVINRKIQNMKFCLYSKYYGRILNIYFFYLIQNSKIFAFQTLNQTHREKVPTTLSFENRAEDLIMEQKIWKQSSRFKNGAVDLKMEQKIWKWSRRFDNRAEDLKME